MISNIKINNFKCIEELQLDCSKLNLFAGVNSSGKSTIIQSILCVAQNVIRPSGLNGDFIELGEFIENKCIYSNNKNVDFKIVDENGEKYGITIEKAQEEGKLIVHSIDIEESVKSQFDRNNRKFSYISCHRIGPQDYYKKNLALDDYVDINGEYAISYLNMHGADPIEECLCKNYADLTLLGQVNYWLNYIVQTEVSTETILGTNMVKASYKMYDNNNVRPVNVGAGISYLISIIITCLASADNSMIIIENPEIHLHPGAQSRLCEFLYFIASNNRQLFIETHSDHIFNGFRAGISSEEMDKDIINLQFVYLNEKHTTESMKVEVGKFGKILNQRPDLFDQFDLDLDRMLGI